MISLGTYPEITLAAAKVRRDEYRAMVAQGIDPSAQHQAAKEYTEVEGAAADERCTTTPA